MLRLGAVAVLVLVLAFPLAPGVSAQTVIVSCRFQGSSGDHISRGFYVSPYPGSNLGTVYLKYSASVDGVYAVSLTARLGTYDGLLIGTQKIVVNLYAGSQADVTFDFGGAPVEKGSTVTFKQELVSGPGFVYYDCGVGSCPGVTQTEGTTPPLDTFRRNSVGLEITELESVDVVAPVTEASYDGAWHTQNFIISLSAEDLGGVAETYYRINDGPTKKVSSDGQPTLTTEGVNNRLEYWSVDRAANEELPHKVLTGIKLDRTSPSGSVVIAGGAAYASSSSVLLGLSATDATSGVASMSFSNDNTGWTAWEVY